MRLARTLVLTILLFSHLSAQDNAVGTIVGSVFDEATGDPLIGATVRIDGGVLGAPTDLDGHFTILNVPPGTYGLRVSYVGYSSKLITDVEVASGGSARIDVTLSEETVEVQEVVVTARAIRSSEASILSMRKQSTSIGDGISAEMIKRAPDATSADALKRVVGVSIMDNKYVLVRGVSDRYNLTTLNGATMNSTDTESDKRSFSFDMIPSNLLDNTIVVKTATPDKPGDFTGGLVELRTMDFPDDPVVKLSLGSSFNTITTGRVIAASRGGSTDWLGMDDGTRSAPQEGLDGFNAWKDIPGDWSTKSVRAPVNQSLSLAYGDRHVARDWEIGYVAALSYKGGYTRTESYQDFTIGAGSFKLDGTNDEYSVLWGGIGDLHLKFGNGNHKLSLRNAYNRSADDKVQFRRGVDFQDREIISTVSQWSERSIYSGQLSGDHHLNFLNDADLTWRFSYSTSTAEEPDRKRLKYQRANGEDTPYSIAGTENNERAWTALEEFSRGSGVDLTVPVMDLKVKVGGAFESSNRTYDVRFQSAEFIGNNYTATFLPADSIFLSQNFGPGGWIVRNLSDKKDTYTADRRILAGYAMADVPFTVLGQKFRAVGGIRVEDARLRAFTNIPAFIDGKSTFLPDTALLENTDLLPSINLTYAMNEIMNLRLAFSNAVNRPELREIANVSYYDFVNYEELRGNPNLKRAWVENYDIRYEFYPNIGEILAVSGFYKKIYDAIEQRVVWSSNPGKEYINTPLAENYGWELEFRKSFAFVHDWLQRLVLTGNYSRIFSKVQFSEVRIIGLTPDYVPIKETFTDIRSMQGQATYTLNGGLHFTDPDMGTSVSLMYNRFGKRVEAVADIREEDIFEEPRGTLDISLTQKLTSNLEMKFTGRDVTASTRRFVLRSGQVYRDLIVGATYGLQFSYAL